MQKTIIMRVHRGEKSAFGYMLYSGLINTNLNVFSGVGTRRSCKICVFLVLLRAIPKETWLVRVENLIKAHTGRKVTFFRVGNRGRFGVGAFRTL